MDVLRGKRPAKARSSARNIHLAHRDILSKRQQGTDGSAGGVGKALAGACWKVSRHATLMLLLALCWLCTGPELALYGPCTGPVLALCWPCTGLVLALYWPCTGRCTGPVPALYWPCTGPVLALCCPVLALYWPCTGLVLALY